MINYTVIMIPNDNHHDNDGCTNYHDGVADGDNDDDEVGASANEEANGNIGMTDASSEVGSVLDNDEGELFLFPRTCTHHSRRC